MNKGITGPVILLIGLIELLIGVVTLCGVTFFGIFSIVEKPAGTFIFVIVSALISMSLGYGILRSKMWARTALVFFSGYVITLKILIYLGVVQFVGQIVTVPPQEIRDAVSLLYHGTVMMFLLNKDVAARFIKKEDVHG